ncbi:MAG: hypothetical protein SGJ18_05285 [Pseudomonadota bacterium]|nr:hypothetical protein [Pseudomonadota bacterium]
MSPAKTTIKSSAVRSKVSKPSDKRRSLRYIPDVGDYAIICFNKKISQFQTDVLGIILNESNTGCSIVIAGTNKLQKDDQIVAQIGRLEALHATVIWRKEIDKDVVKLGLRYDE